jgi:hypothetical protein
MGAVEAMQWLQAFVADEARDRAIEVEGDWTEVWLAPISPAVAQDLESVPLQKILGWMGFLPPSPEVGHWRVPAAELSGLVSALDPIIQNFPPTVVNTPVAPDTQEQANRERAEAYLLSLEERLTRSPVNPAAPAFVPAAATAQHEAGCHQHLCPLQDHLLPELLSPQQTWASKLDSVVSEEGIPASCQDYLSYFPSAMQSRWPCLHSIQDNLEASIVLRSLKALISKDKLVSNIAWDQLPKGEASRSRPLCVVPRAAVPRHLRVELGYVDNHFVVEFNGSCSHWRPMADMLKKAKEARRLHQVLGSSDQGRSFHCISLHPSSSHWIPTGSYVSFAEYKFALRARLNLLPVGTVAKRLRKVQNATCRKCRVQQESLGHVLNHCLPNAGLMRERHNTILSRVVRAIRKDGKDVFVEQSISPDALKPDIVVRDQATKATTVVDVTVPYEGSANAFLQARTLKEQKYAGLKSWMEGQEEYGAVTVHAFVVGALGAWDTPNKECLWALGIGRGYTTLFQKLCAVDAIKGSHAIWRSHRATLRS